MTEAGRPDMVAYLLGRVRELEDLVFDLTKKLQQQAEKQKNYRRSLKAPAARSNDDVTLQVRSSNDAVTPLPLCGNAAPGSPSHTLPLQELKSSNIKYLSPLADFVAATWPQKALTEEQEKAWREACPGVDLLAAAKGARAWQLEDKIRRTRPRALQFLGNWFRTEQQKLKATPIRNGTRGAQLHIETEKLKAEPAGRKML